MDIRHNFSLVCTSVVEKPNNEETDMDCMRRLRTNVYVSELIQEEMNEVSSLLRQ